VSCSLTTQIMIISHCLTNWKALTTALPPFTHVRPSLYVKYAWPITQTAQRHRTPRCLRGLDPRDSRNLWVSLSLPRKSRPCSVPELWGGSVGPRRRRRERRLVLPIQRSSVGVEREAPASNLVFSNERERGVRERGKRKKKKKKCKQMNSCLFTVHVGKKKKGLK
jgi:hypothetical protein